MNRWSKGAPGFTVIEVTLFLAVTGLMMAGIFVGITGAINRQQYEDTIISLVDQMQGQYNLVNNVRSNRPTELNCSLGTAAIADTGGSGRGTSACTTIGRLITSDNGENFMSKPVFATEDVTAPRDSSDNEKTYIGKLGLALADDAIMAADIENYSLPWRSEVYVNGDTGKKQFSMLILNLPSGMTRTYAAEGVSTSPQSLAEQVIDSGSPSLRLCVVGGGFGSPANSGVRILPLASNVSGVQRIAASETADAC